MRTASAPFVALVFLVGCSSAPSDHPHDHDDAGTVDAGEHSHASDAGHGDAGPTDAGADAGVADAGAADAGVADAGSPVPDAGTCKAANAACGLDAECCSSMCHGGHCH